ncbi:serpin family protein [Flavilitoribacter nigricans]|nr:serpin family protein [Flavilitoribacter nigricans]
MTVLTLLGCNITDEVIPGTTDPGTGDVEPELVTYPLGSFGWEVVQQTLQRANETSNTVISPLSIAAALYMTYNGADGETRSAMNETLKLNGISVDSLNAAYRQLAELLENTREGVRLSSANAVFWDENRVDPAESFLAKLTAFYEAETFAEDFRNNPDAVLNKINAWVNEETEGRIEKILEELNPEEVMFLINALYFIGDWDKPFDPDQTSDRPFTTSDGREIMVPTMYQDSQFKYYDGTDFKGVSCTFADTSLAMWFVLPPADQDIDQFIASLAYDDLVDRFNTQAITGRLDLQLPKFKINYKIQLNDVLKAMGMEIAFDPMEADFSNLGTATGNLYISRVEHKTFLKIDEKGAEGAAVTSVGIAATSLPPSIKFNRPFLTVLLHKATKTPIFVGKIEDPTSEQ